MMNVREAVGELRYIKTAKAVVARGVFKSL
jgi:hypothetical protein